MDCWNPIGQLLGLTVKNYKAGKRMTVERKHHHTGRQNLHRKEAGQKQAEQLFALKRKKALDLSAVGENLDLTVLAERDRRDWETKATDENTAGVRLEWGGGLALAFGRVLQIAL
jgi:hypothetical protein